MKRFFANHAWAGKLWKTPKLFTPGPLNTSTQVKQAMLVDYGSRTDAIINAQKYIRRTLLETCNVSQETGYECVLMQGSGTMAVESVISSIVSGKMLILSNGAYGKRMATIAKLHNIPHDLLEFPETEPVCIDKVQEHLKNNTYDFVATVHHETTVGVLNPIDEISTIVPRDTTFIVDSMSGLGAFPVDLDTSKIDYLVSSSNKNFEGVPGFAFVLANREKLVEQGKTPKTLSLDLLSQWEGLEANGQFRFTPPTHSLMAFQEALREFKLEGGSSRRLHRYNENAYQLRKGMESLGFKAVNHSPIISTFLYPDDFDFEDFYEKLAEESIYIYPGKMTEADCFRIGTIGQIYEDDIHELLYKIKEVMY